MQCNALNVRTTAKQVWLYFIHRTTRLEYAGSTTNLQIAFNAHKNPYLNPRLNQTTQKVLAKIFQPKKIPESKISNLKKKSFDHPRHLKSGVPSWNPAPRMFHEDDHPLHRRTNTTGLLLTLTSGLSSRPFSIGLADSGEVANKFVLRVTFQYYGAEVGEFGSVQDAICRCTRITTANN